MSVRDFTHEVLEIMEQSLDKNPGEFWDGMGDFFRNIGTAFTGNYELKEDLSNLENYLRYYMETQDIGAKEFETLLNAIQEIEDRYKTKFEENTNAVKDSLTFLKTHEISREEMQWQFNFRMQEDYVAEWYGRPMQLNGTTPEEIHLKWIINNVNSEITDPRLIWTQDKIDELWHACEVIYDEYGIVVDPRLLLSVIRWEGTGSFNTSPTNIAGDGQHGVEVNYAVDLVRANDLLIGNVLGYIVYQDQFREAVQANNDGTYRYIEGNGNIIQYINWQTVIIRPDGRVQTGVYAGNVYWAKNVSETFELLGGNVERYDLLVANTNPSVIEAVVGHSVELPEYDFVVEYQTADRQDIYNPDEYGNPPPDSERTSITAHRA
jgi:hypothetical protein